MSLKHAENCVENIGKYTSEKQIQKIKH